jgi:mono/diheme cytochrome c family protein
MSRSYWAGPTRVVATSLACKSAFIAVIIVPAASGAEPTSAMVAKGAAVYQDYCSTCHGEELRNTSGGVTFDLRRLRPQDHDRFVSSVLNGKAQMPPWRGVLDNQQIEAIWAYIRATVDK